MPALIFEPYLPVDATSEIPVWSVVEQENGVGPASEPGDTVTVEVIAWVEQNREVLNTYRTGLPYTFLIDDGPNDALLIRAVQGMKSGGERFVSRRGLLLAVGNILPSASELTLRVRLIHLQRHTKR